MAEQANYLKNLKTESVVQQVINCLTDGMVSGQLKPGDKLPSEPELAAQLGGKLGLAGQLVAGFELAGDHAVGKAVYHLLNYGLGL